MFVYINKIMESKNILLTGGAGFIGSHIAEEILRLNPRKLVIVDNLSTGNVENISEIISDPRVEFYHNDITKLEVCKCVMEGIDIVCHQAALGSVPRSIADPLSSHDSNVNGFLNILFIAKEAGVKRFVYASSSSVYGDSQTLPKQEDEVGDVISPYAATKKINEIYAGVFHKCYGIECIGLRYFNIFGPRQNKNGPYAAVIPRFISALVAGESCVINGDGEQSRDFTYVSNAVQANILAMLTDNTKCFGKVFNVASGGRVTLNEMYHIMKEYLGSSIDPIYGPVRKGDIEHSHASIRLAHRMLGYNPKVTFIEGLQLTIDSFL